MFSQNIALYCFKHRLKMLISIFIVTCYLGWTAMSIDVKTYFKDLLPTGHPYIAVNEANKTSFGGANEVAIMVEVEQGDIFTLDTLAVIRNITLDLRLINAVNQFQIISLASKKMKTFTSSSEGIESRTLMWPDLPQSQAEVAQLRLDVLASPIAYGRYVSTDLKAAIITVDFLDHLLNYNTAYQQISEIINKYQQDGIKIRVVGQPVLNGIVHSYLGETIEISYLIIAAVALILLVTLGNMRGVFMPLLAASFSGLWALGISHLLGINLDPLGIVIAFLIAARAISHAVQINLAFDNEKHHYTQDSKVAARHAMTRLFRPGVLGLITDAGGILVVTLAPIPLLQKAAVLGTIWVGSMVICNVIMNPLLLSFMPNKSDKPLVNLGIGKVIVIILSAAGWISSNKKPAAAVLLIAFSIILLGSNKALDLTIGDAKPGTPLLWPEHKYNTDDTAISQRFPGSDRMFVVVQGNDNDALKQPEVLNNISLFQQYMESRDEIGNTTSLADIIRPINMLLNEGNPRFYKIGDDAIVNAELLYLALANSEPGDIERFGDLKYKTGAVQMMVKDHQGDTIRKVIQSIHEFKQEHPMVNADLVLAGGLTGVLAAVNEEIFAGQAQSIAMALLVLFICCALAYRSPQAGLFFLPLVLISNIITFAYMSHNGIGLIGLGVDFAFYIVDRVKEELAIDGDLQRSIVTTLKSTGRGIIITALTMFASIIFWYFFSSLRFQAEMGILIALWMTVSAISALLVIPSMIYIFKPSFVLSSAKYGLAKQQAVPMKLAS
jgi:predicted RND superfamily exporter protein